MELKLDESLGEIGKSDAIKIILLCLAVGITIYVVRENNKLRQQLSMRRPCDEAVLEQIARASAHSYPDGAYKPGTNGNWAEPPKKDQIPDDIPVEGFSGPPTDGVD